MPLRAYCEERFWITVSLGPASALGEKAKKRGQIRKISASEASQTGFFSPFPRNEGPDPRLVYSQTEKIVNTRNISGMLLCCAKKQTNKQTNKKQ